MKKNISVLLMVSCFVTLLLAACKPVSVNQSSELATQVQDEIVVGASQFSQYLPLLKDKRVGLVVNQTSRVNNLHLVDALLAKGVNVVMIFAPEHGFRGDHDAGASVENSVDSKTGITVHSIYGKNKQPSSDIMDNVDIVLFDIQDVGVRFYTYISSMHYMMQAAAESHVEFVVLDRPNPNIAYVEGPVLETKFRSFVGMHEIPILHGMTVGELALMIDGQSWLVTDEMLNLTVIPVKNYQRTSLYSLPIKPSPNLPNDTAIALYPSLCFFEPTAVSIGRGTEFPFQVVGHDEVYIGDFSFTPMPIQGAASNPKLKGQKLYGQDLRNATISGLDLTALVQWYQAFEQAGTAFFTSESFFDKLAGTDKLRLALMAGKSATEIQQSWQADIEQFKRLRQPYLLYH